MEPNEVHILTAAVLRDSQQVLHTAEPGFTREIICDVFERDRLNRVHDDVAVVHAVAAADLHVRPRPDADRAPDASAPDSLSKVSGKLHCDLPADGPNCH